MITLVYLVIGVFFVLAALIGTPPLFGWMSRDAAAIIGIGVLLHADRERRP